MKERVTKGFGSIEKNRDFQEALSNGSVVPKRVPAYLPLPFAGKPRRVFELQTEGLVARLEAIGCRNAVIGLSGGLDSALALLVTCAAFKRLGYDSRGIHVYTMPGFGTSDRTKGNAGALAEGLGLVCETIPIAKAVRQHFRDIGHDGRTKDIAYENAQARMRTLILMDKANMTGGIVIGTGDMSEIALGWSTYNGDHMSMFAVNAGVPKTVVREVCLWWAAKAKDERRKTKGSGKRGGLIRAAEAIVDIVATPVSPELIKGQITEDKLGPYELHDFFLEKFIGMNMRRCEIFEAAFRKFGRGYDAATIGKWLDVFLHRIVRQAFKRNCAPDGVKIYRDVYFGPDDWHIPSDCPCVW